VDDRDPQGAGAPAPAAVFVAGDALRAFAALGVLAYHYAYSSATRSGHTWFSDAYGTPVGRLLGSLEVALYVFFVLSGYLISGPFVRAYLAGRPMPSARRYVRHRVLRIVPAFWVVFTAYLLLHGTYGASLGELAAVYGFAQNYDGSTAAYLVGQAWTLDVEVLFYALVPAVAALGVWAAGRRRPEHPRASSVIGLAAGIWVASLLVRELVPETLGWQRAFPSMLFAFMPGVALAAVDARLGASAWTPRAPRRLAGGLLLAGIVIYAVYAVRAERNFPPLPGLEPAALASLCSACLVAAPLVLQWAGCPAPRIVDNRIARWLGERSYGIYLIHQSLLLTIGPWLDAVDAPTVRLFLTLVIGLPICAAAAAVLHAAVERPAMRLARRSTRGAASAPPRGQLEATSAP